MASRPLETTTFINKWGQQINVGDCIVAVAQGYSHAIKIYTGEFLGHRGNTPVVKIKDCRYDYRTRKYETKERISSLPAGRVFPSDAPVQVK